MSIARHTAYNVAGAVLPVLVSVISVPFYLRLIGPERYGILAICWTLLGFVGFLSIGMGPAITQRLARLENSSERKRAQVVWTASLMTLPMALLAMALVFLASLAYFGTFQQGRGALGEEVRDAVPSLALAVSISLLASVFSGALQGRRWFGSLSIINMSTAIALSFVPLATALILGPELPKLILATTCVNLLSLGALLFVCARAVPLRRSGTPSLKLGLELISYGGWVTGTSLLAPVVMLLDRFIIGAKLGAVAVSTYVIPYNLVSRLTLLPASLCSAALPRFAHEAEPGRLQSQTLNVLLAVLTPLCVIGAALLHPFFNLWIGKSMAQLAAPAGLILISGFWAHGIGHVPSTIMLGRGRPDVITKLLLAYLLPYLLVLYLLLPPFGIVGAAVAWSLRAFCDFVMFLHTQPKVGDALKVGEAGTIVLASVAAGLLLSSQTVLYWVAFGLLLLLACRTAFVCFRRAGMVPSDLFPSAMKVLVTK